jgi:hypothetical protein
MPNIKSEILYNSATRLVSNTVLVTVFDFADLLPTLNICSVSPSSIYGAKCFIYKFRESPLAYGDLLRKRLPIELSFYLFSFWAVSAPSSLIHVL